MTDTLSLYFRNLTTSGPGLLWSASDFPVRFARLISVFFAFMFNFFCNQFPNFALSFRPPFIVSLHNSIRDKIIPSALIVQIFHTSSDGEQTLTDLVNVLLCGINGAGSTEDSLWVNCMLCLSFSISLHSVSRRLFVESIIIWINNLKFLAAVALVHNKCLFAAAGPLPEPLQ